MSTAFDQVPGAVLDDQTIAPRGYFAAEVKQGEVFRIIDVEGQQGESSAQFLKHVAATG